MDDFKIALCRTFFIFALAIGSCCVLSATSVAGELGKAILAERPTEILGGRLSARMPQGAKALARSFNIMPAPESEEHETRLVFDLGQERLVLMAHEKFPVAGDDFEKDARDCVAKWSGEYRIEKLQLPTKELRVLKVIPLNPPDHTRSDDATFVEGRFIESADQTIQSLDVYVNPTADKDLEGCKAVARRILSSVAPGKKRLQLQAGERLLFAYSKDPRISIMVPKNIVVTGQAGPDFLIHRLIVLGRLGADSGTTIKCCNLRYLRAIFEENVGFRRAIFEAAGRRDLQSSNNEGSEECAIQHENAQTKKRVLAKDGVL